MFHLLLNIPFQESLKLITNCPTLAHHFRQKHGRFVSESNADAGLTIHATKNAQYYRIMHSGTTNLAPPCIKSTEPFSVIEDILYHYRRFSSDILALHGATVADRNGARLLLAPTTGGKTTLTCYLTQKGLDYITDDCILVNKDTLQIHPYPEPLHLRKESLEVLRYHHISPEHFAYFEQLQETSFPRYVYTPANCVMNPLPIHSIYFLERTDGLNALQTMSTTACVSALLQAPIMEYPMNASHIQFMTRLAKHPCYKLYYSDMHYVLNTL